MGLYLIYFGDLQKSYKDYLNKKIDIKDKANPYIIQSWEVPNYSSGVFVKDNNIYVANYRGLIILEDK